MPASEIDPVKHKILDAILREVPFSGWSQKAFDDAVAEIGLTPAAARSLCPRGAVDMAVAYHQAGDAAMVAAVQGADLTGMKFRDKVAFAIRARLAAITDKEVVRRGMALFALPQHAAEGTKLIWGTADAIWTVLGDTSDDFNWYTKRLSLSGVWASTILFWLGDQSPDAEATDAFIDRRIEDVMQVEKVKAQVNSNRLLKPVTDPLNSILSRIRAPQRAPAADLPGHWTEPN